MVDNCKHVNKIKTGIELGILNPERWQCCVCGTTESVWACLSCPYVACGRFNEEHALRHYVDSGHSLCIEVNEKFVFCYDCDDYILNDNAPSDIKLVRMALDAVAEQNFDSLQENENGRRILRSHHAESAKRSKRLLKADLVHTALFKHRISLLSWVLRRWLTKWRRKKSPPDGAEETNSRSTTGGQKRKASSLIRLGTTGLRNLGNTCYMNSVLQVLSHTADFSGYVISHPPHKVLSASALSASHANPSPGTSKAASPAAGLLPVYTRQTTTECLQQVEAPLSSAKSVDGDSDSSASLGNGTVAAGGFLNGGSSSLKATQAVTYADQPPTTLYEALHALLRVLWSGKRAVVSPHGLLADVWLNIPGFKGYKQQDAQEFFCELLDRLQSELHEWNPGIQDFITRSFQGRLLNVVRCSACGHTRNAEEPFLDLSLAFPSSCHRGEADECTLDEMLDLFSRETDCGGGGSPNSTAGGGPTELTYECEACNSGRAAGDPVRYTGARQTLCLRRLPRVLRLHLKRFKWCGRQREKLSCRIHFPHRLDVARLCMAGEAEQQPSEYLLIGVIVHHGRGFMSGHYTAYCLNDATDSWIHCNDSKVTHVSPEEVAASQAYILVYSRIRPLTSTTPNRRRPPMPVPDSKESPGVEDETRRMPVTKRRRRSVTQPL